jgi:cyanophycinase
MRRRSVLDAFVASAGGTQARIAVVSSASSLGVEVVEVYRGVFTSLGAGQVISLRPESRAEAHDPDLVEQLRTVSAVFLTGGNQLKLSSFITGTPVGRQSRKRMSAARWLPGRQQAPASWLNT